MVEEIKILECVFPPVNTVPGAFVDEIDEDTDEVWNNDEEHCLSRVLGDSVSNSTVEDDTDDTVGDSF